MFESSREFGGSRISGSGFRPARTSAGRPSQRGHLTARSREGRLRVDETQRVAGRVIGVEGPLAPGSNDDFTEWTRRIIVQEPRSQALQSACPLERRFQVVGRKVQCFRRRREPGGAHGGVIQDAEKDRPAIEVDTSTPDFPSSSGKKELVEASRPIQIPSRQEHAEESGTPFSRHGRAHATGRIKDDHRPGVVPASLAPKPG